LRIGTIGAMPAPQESPRIIDSRALTALRVARNWSQRELGRKALVDQSTISKIERGLLGEKCAETRNKLARALGVEPEVLTPPAARPEPMPAKPSPSRRKPPVGPLTPRVVEIQRSPRSRVEPVSDPPLALALLAVAVAEKNKYSWADIQTANEAVLGTQAEINGACDLDLIARAMLDSARNYRLRGGKPEGAVLAVVSGALYHLGAKRR
jgi:transcriptional regulator with XRE-family HTH domain